MEKSQNNSERKDLSKLEKASLAAGIAVASFGVGYIGYGLVKGNQEMVNDGYTCIKASALPIGLTLLTYLSRNNRKNNY